MEIDLLRYKITPRSIGGKLALNGVFECYSLERAYTDPDYKPIPTGRYNVQVFMSPHFKRLIPHLMDVPGREAIEIHLGNRPTDSHGCIIIGQQLGQDEVYSSLIALINLVGKLINLKEPIYINIREENHEEAA